MSWETYCTVCVQGYTVGAFGWESTYTALSFSTQSQTDLLAQSITDLDEPAVSWTWEVMTLQKGRVEKTRKSGLNASDRKYLTGHQLRSL